MIMKLCSSSLLWLDFPCVLWLDLLALFCLKLTVLASSCLQKAAILLKRYLLIGGRFGAAKPRQMAWHQCPIHLLRTNGELSLNSHGSKLWTCWDELQKHLGYAKRNRDGPKSNGFSWFIACHGHFYLRITHFWRNPPTLHLPSSKVNSCLQLAARWAKEASKSPDKAAWWPGDMYDICHNMS